MRFRDSWMSRSFADGDRRARRIATWLRPQCEQLEFRVTPASVVFQGETFERTISFSGHIWGVKHSESLTGPGPNYFSNDPGAVFVDAQDNLHLKVVKIGDRWHSTEVVLLNHLGYGTYAVQTASNLEAKSASNPGGLPPNVVAGYFTYDLSAPAPHREIDIEDGRFNNSTDPMDSQFAVQPYYVDGNTARYKLPALGGDPSLTRGFRWEPGLVAFYRKKGFVSAAELTQTAPLFSVDNWPQNAVPTPGNESFRINAWVFPGGAPSDEQAVEVIIKNFSFTAIPSTNRAPILSGFQAELISVPEGSGVPTGPTGTLVSTLLSQVAFSDVDANSQQGIAVKDTDVGHGTWYYSLDDGASWLVMPSVSNSSSLLLAANARVTFRPNSGFSGQWASSFRFRGWDRTSGTNGGLASAEANGGSSAFSPTDAQALITITTTGSPNTAPTLSVNQIELNPIPMNLGSPSGPTGTLVSTLLSRAGFSDSDPNSRRGMALTAIDNSNGTWHYSLNDGTTWPVMPSLITPNALLLAADARVAFRPNPGYDGIRGSSFQFLGWDQTTGANGTVASAAITGGSSAFSVPPQSPPQAFITIVPGSLKPVVASIAPFVGPTTGFAVAIKGTNFVGATKVTFQTTDVAIPSNPSDTTIVVMAPRMNLVGSVNVTVTGPGGTSVPTAFTPGIDQIAYRPTKVSGVVIGDDTTRQSVIRSIALKFDGLIDSAPTSAFAITDQANNPILGLTVDVVGVGTNALTLTFSDSNAVNVGPVTYGSLADGLYRLKVDGSLLASGSVAVDADGNGTAGGTSTTDFTRLFGDYNGNAFVDATDLYPFLVNSIDKGEGDVGYNSAFDFNGDGFVDATDIYPEIVTRIDTGL